MTSYGHDKPTCRHCGGTLVIARRTPDRARPDYERQKLECVACGEHTTRVVDSTGRPVR